MSVTRLICKCGYPQVYCKCPLPSAPSAQAPVQDRGASQLVGSGSLVGGRRPNRRGVSPLFGAMLAAAMIGSGMGAMMHGYQPPKPRDKSPEDLARIAAAKAKQDRKRALKEAQKTKAPNSPAQTRAD